MGFDRSERAQGPIYIIKTNNSMTCTWYFQLYRLVIFQNSPNTTHRLAAIVIIVKYNATTGHAITYANTLK